MINIFLICAFVIYLCIGMVMFVTVTLPQLEFAGKLMKIKRLFQVTFLWLPAMLGFVRGFKK